MDILSITKVRDGINAYCYFSGVIEIAGVKYVGYSIKAAIQDWKRKNRK
jgi:hypothetical protein